MYKNLCDAAGKTIRGHRADLREPVPEPHGAGQGKAVVVKENPDHRADRRRHADIRLRRDHAVVLNGLSLPYSSGAVEGENCKIKHLKRIMFGRANLDLLRTMILYN